MSIYEGDQDLPTAAPLPFRSLGEELSMSDEFLAFLETSTTSRKYLCRDWFWPVIEPWSQINKLNYVVIYNDYESIADYKKSATKQCHSSCLYMLQLAGTNEEFQNVLLDLSPRIRNVEIESLLFFNDMESNGNASRRLSDADTANYAFAQRYESKQLAITEAQQRSGWSDETIWFHIGFETHLISHYTQEMLFEPARGEKRNAQCRIY